LFIIPNYKQVGRINVEEKKFLLKVIKTIGRKKVIDKLKISTQRLNSWINEDIEMPYEYALMLEFLTCGEIKAEALSPKKAKRLKQIGIKVHVSKTEETL
jgi:DNA-binding transcriptional regulator YdaS (Cro superfamily)